MYAYVGLFNIETLFFCSVMDFCDLLSCFFLRPPAPSNNVFVQTNPFGVPSQNSSVFVTKGLSSERQGKISKVFIYDAFSVF